MPFETIQTQTANGIFHIRLNRPDSLNSVNAKMREELLAALSDAEGSGDIRVVLITGAGKGFCAGQDLAELDVSAATRAEEVRVILEDGFNPVILKLRALPQPVVVGVHGVAAGAGASLSFAADILLAAKGARFVLAFVQAGLVPDAGCSYFLPRLVGPMKARELAMTGQPLGAEDAFRFGLVSSLVDDEDAEQGFRSYAEMLVEKAPVALRLMKQAMNCSMENGLSEQLSLESKFQQAAASTLDYVEGVTAFLEKRTPKFRGA